MDLGEVGWVVLGAALTLPMLFWGRKYSQATQRRIWSSGLLVAALIYVVFAIVGGAGESWLGIELLGVLVYGFAAWRGRSVTLWLAAGWGLHVLWDVLLHGGHDTAFVPAWYPTACLGFDLAVATYLGWLSRR